MNSRLVVLGWQRSGTSVFRELLSLNGYADLGEVFHSEFLDDDTKFFHFVQQRAAEQPRVIHPMYYADLFQEYVESVLSRYHHIVIDIKYSALRIIDREANNHNPLVLDALAFNNYSFCQVVRRNKLRSIVSLYLAIQTGIWAKNAALQEQHPYVKIIIPTETLISMIEERYCQEKVLDSWLTKLALGDGRRLYKIFYEDMFDPLGQFSLDATNLAVELTKFTDEPLKTNVALTKQNTELLESIIENYEDVKSVLRQSPYEWMLHY